MSNKYPIEMEEKKTDPEKDISASSLKKIRAKRLSTLAHTHIQSHTKILLKIDHLHV